MFLNAYSAVPQIAPKLRIIYSNSLQHEFRPRPSDSFLWTLTPLTSSPWANAVFHECPLPQWMKKPPPASAAPDYGVPVTSYLRPRPATSIDPPFQFHERRRRRTLPPEGLQNGVWSMNGNGNAEGKSRGRRPECGRACLDNAEGWCNIKKVIGNQRRICSG